jgi:hypothetical protein
VRAKHCQVIWSSYSLCRVLIHVRQLTDDVRWAQAFPWRSDPNLLISPVLTNVKHGEMELEPLRYSLYACSELRSSEETSAAVQRTELDKFTR